MNDVASSTKKIMALQTRTDLNAEQKLVLAKAIQSGIEPSYQDASIPSEFMQLFLDLERNYKIDPTSYVKAKSYQLGLSPNLLKHFLLAKQQGLLVSFEEALQQGTEWLQNKLNEWSAFHSLEERVKQNPELQTRYQYLRSFPFSAVAIGYLLRNWDQINFTNFRHRERLPEYSFEQLKYLCTISSFDSIPEQVENPDLSLEEMRQFVCQSPHSQQFLEELKESHSQRKK